MGKSQRAGVVRMSDARADLREMAPCCIHFGRMNFMTISSRLLFNATLSLLRCFARPRAIISSADPHPLEVWGFSKWHFAR